MLELKALLLISVLVVLALLQLLPLWRECRIDVAVEIPQIQIQNQNLKKKKKRYVAVDISFYITARS